MKQSVTFSDVDADFAKNITILASLLGEECSIVTYPISYLQAIGEITGNLESIWQDATGKNWDDLRQLIEPFNQALDAYFDR